MSTSDESWDSALENRLRSLWQVLYGSQDAALEELVSEVKYAKSVRFGADNTSKSPLPRHVDTPAGGHDPEWFKDAVTYSVYVDLFNTSFTGLQEKLDHLHDLGITCLHLLPILDSPMKGKPCGGVMVTSRLRLRHT